MSDIYWKNSKDEFRKIFDTIGEVRKTSNDIIKYIEELDKMYKNLLNYKTNDKNLLYFGLNTFYFQIRFLQSQFDDSKRQFVFLLNHFYADYYKLFKLIQYHVESGSDQNLKIKIDLETTFPIYDDLSPYTQYKETDIIALQGHILKILEIIDTENEEFAKTNSINDLQNNHQNGIPIANFIHGLSHEQTIMEEYINLYKHYLEFFQNFYTDECNSYKKKLENLFEHIKEHAPLNDNPLFKNKTFASQNSNSKPEPDQDEESKPDSKPETKPDSKPDSKPEPDQDEESKPENKPETKPESKPETKPETKPDIKIETNNSNVTLEKKEKKEKKVTSMSNIINKK